MFFSNSFGRRLSGSRRLIATFGLALTFSLSGCGDSGTSPSDQYNLTDSDLGSLTTSVGTVTPTFAKSVSHYYVVVTAEQTTIKVKPVAAMQYSYVRVNGIRVVSGNETNDIPLKETGPTDISIMVSPNESTPGRTYTLTVTRE